MFINVSYNTSNIFIKDFYIECLNTLAILCTIVRKIRGKIDRRTGTEFQACETLL